MLKIEIASYPKSGNTWFRHLARDFLSKLHGERIFDYPPDIHQSFEKVKNYNALFVKPINDNVMIYKSHIFYNPKVKPDKIIHIYRHPLDVFLSAMNYLYHQSHKFNQNRLNELFINGKPKSVESIVSDQEMDYYFHQFLEQAGSTYWPRMLGHNSNYFSYTLNALELDNAFSIKYEDLLRDTSSATNTAFRGILGDIPYISVNIDKINKETKESNNRKFFWKSTSKNYENFLTDEQISTFSEKYNSELCALGYL